MHRDGPRPNLFVIGAMKAGTTSLHRYLSSHPDVFMCEPKEPGFFVPELKYYPRDEAWYRSLFAAAGDARVVGEASTHYAKLPVYGGVPERIAAYSPDARFIYVMRDPVERTLSHYWYHVRLYGTGKPMLQAFRENVAFRAFSDYPMQLAPYFERFGADRVLCLTFEEMVADPRGTISGVLEWLGLRTDVPMPELGRENARPERVRQARGLGLLGRLARSGVWDLVSPAVPAPLKRLGRRRAFASVAPAEVPTAEAIEHLRPEMAEMVERLARLLGRDFPRWTTTLGGRRELAAR